MAGRRVTATPALRKLPPHPTCPPLPTPTHKAAGNSSATRLQRVGELLGLRQRRLVLKQLGAASKYAAAAAVHRVLRVPHHAQVCGQELRQAVALIQEEEALQAVHRLDSGRRQLQHRQ